MIMTMPLLTPHTVVTPYNLVPPLVESWFGLETKLLVSLVCLASLPAVAGFCLLVLVN
jgi:hypothetical protein